MFKKNNKKTKKESSDGSEGNKRVLLRRKPLVSDVDTAEGDGVESRPVLLWLLDSMYPLHFILSHFWGPQYLHPPTPRDLTSQLGNGMDSWPFEVVPVLEAGGQGGAGGGWWGEQMRLLHTLLRLKTGE